MMGSIDFPYETLAVEVDDRVAVVTINRPEVRNALSRQVTAEVQDALEVLADADDVGLVAFTGAGEKAFVAGADIAQLRRLADQILAKGPLAVRLAKLVVRAGMDADQRTGQVVERLAQAVLYTTADKAEGTSAFLEKRAPSFKGV